MRHRSYFGMLLVLVGTCCASFGAWGERPPHGAQPTPPTFDEVTGRDLANYPPSPRFDHLHMKLEIKWMDPAKAELEAVETLRVKAIGNTRKSIVLNAPSAEHMKLIKVSSPQTQVLTPHHVGETLEISIDPPLASGDELTLEFHYTLDFSDSKGDGLSYHAGNPDSKSLTRQTPMVYSQGQAELNRRWFICHDFPNERLTTEMVVHVPPQFQAISNGALESHESSAMEEVWHWTMHKPHVNYLVMLAMGKWAKLDLPPAKIQRDGKLAEIPCTVWTPLGTEADALKVFSSTPTMIEYFSTQFDEPYPWEKYDQVLVRDYGFGGMENTTATILGDRMLRQRGDDDPDDLTSHELAHQWFGDYLTCRSWEHIWLNEGWATYAEALWQDRKAGGGDPGRKAYSTTLEHYRDQQYVLNANPPEGSAALVDKRYPNADAIFEKHDDPYAKGGWVLHMLRNRLGDNAFWAGVHAYVHKWRLGEVETSDFRRELEMASGESLEKFFHQWCTQPGFPLIEYNTNWDEKTGVLSVAWKQTQTISARNPAWEVDLPVHLWRGNEAWRFQIPIRERSGSFAFTALPGEKPEITMDPDMQLLCSVREVLPAVVPAH